MQRCRQESYFTRFCDNAVPEADTLSMSNFSVTAKESSPKQCLQILKRPDVRRRLGNDS